MFARMPLLLPLDRRTLLGGASGLALSPLVPAWIVPAAAGAGSDAAIDDDITFEGEEPPLPDDLRSAAGEPRFSDYEGALATAEMRGTAQPTDKESATAFDVLACAPFGCEPYKVAQYFYDVGQGKFESDWRSYAREWPVRANPVIVEFFRATTYKPSGDQSPWCAAFVNWCIARGNSKSGAITDAEHSLGTKSAASGSFRCWDKAEPKVGDIVVFSQRNSLSESCSGQGHVGFFLGFTQDNRIRVLGGNQTLEGKSCAVTVANFPKTNPMDTNRKLVLYGYRTKPVLDAPAPVAAPATGSAAAPPADAPSATGSAAPPPAAPVTPAP